jgi:hypothetical protein
MMGGCVVDVAVNIVLIVLAEIWVVHALRMHHRTAQPVRNGRRMVSSSATDISGSSLTPGVP